MNTSPHHCPWCRCGLADHTSIDTSIDPAAPAYALVVELDQIAEAQRRQRAAATVARNAAARAEVPS